MDALKRKILSEGRAQGESILMVDSFLNHQVDAGLMAEIGREFQRLTAHLRPTRVVTIETSGIAPAQMTALYMNLPLVIFRKAKDVSQSPDVLQIGVRSFTKNAVYQLTVKAEYIPPGDRVLFIDDFLAAGEAAAGTAQLVERRGASVVGMGIVIEKSFQDGRRRLDALGYEVFSLARIARMRPAIEFLND